MPTIIDGYNLIFTCGLEGRSRSPVALERARDRLLMTLSNQLDPAELKATTVVFDAKRLPIKTTEKDSLINGIRVLYAVDYPDADTQIEELIRKHSTPKKLTVVSSDHRLQTAAQRRKATALDSDVWYDQLLSHPPNSLGDKNASDHSQLDHSEQAAIDSLRELDWASEFGSLDQPADIQTPAPNQPVEPEPPGFNPFPPGYGEDLLE